MTQDDRGWRRFFGVDPYPFDLDLVAQREDTLLEISLLERCLPRKGSVLDAGCGRGRHTTGLIYAGYAVLAIDAIFGNARMTALRCPSATVVCCDVNSLPFAAESFDSVVSLYTSLGYNAPVVAGLEELRRCVRPGGVLIWDMSLCGPPYVGFERIPNGFGMFAGFFARGRRYHWSVANQRGRVRGFSLSFETLRAEEVQDTLIRSGWEPLEMHENYRGKPFSEAASTRVIAVARAC